MRETAKKLGLKASDTRPAAHLVVVLAAELDLLAELTSPYVWEAKDDRGPRILRSLVDVLGYEPTPDEIELASGEFGKPEAKKPAAKKAPVKKAAAKKATPVKKAAPRSRATVVSPAKASTS